MHPALIAGCVAIIAVGVAVIMYTLFRTPKTPAGFGARPSISLGDMPENGADGSDPEKEAVEEGNGTSAEERGE